MLQSLNHLNLSEEHWDFNIHWLARKHIRKCDKMELATAFKAG